PLSAPFSYPLHQPPRSPLFPYTTLFRSEDGRAMLAACATAGTLLFVNHTRRFNPLLRRLRNEVVAGAYGDVVQVTGYYTAGLFKDRKSTRLNSSHVAISYAVFCLKKKNN